MTREVITGQNSTAVENPVATRSVIYANGDSSKKVTITVDQYVSSTDAAYAYREAVQRSKSVAGFKPLAAANLDQNAFVGTVTEAEETHIGLGALNGTLIVGITLVGYEPTPGTTAKLISLSREQEDAAKVAVAAKAHR